ncbi:MAG: ABC transporter substrate-binding protein [Clostridiales bacterium]|nr:ABC transporter substrate-binding protein [Clostridiales bacterium]
MKKVTRLISLICAFLIMACGCDIENTNQPAPKPIVLGFSQLGDESTWRSQNSRSIIDAAKEAGIKIMFDDAMQDPENQIKAIRSFIAYKVDVIAFSPLVETGWDTVLEEAKAAGIPVIIVDRMIDTEDDSLYACALCSDFDLEGRRAGQFLVDKYRNETRQIKIVELAGTVDSTPAIGRYEGFRSVISSDPKFEVVFSASGDFMLSKGREIMQQVLKHYRPEEIDVLYSHNDDMTFGAIEVMIEAGIKPGEDIVIISVDATQRIIDYLKNGTVNCVIECNPNSGPQVMEIAQKIVAGEEVEKQIYIKEQVFDENTDFTTIADRGY